jgi:prepilin peptidase CpaA
VTAQAMLAAAVGVAACVDDLRRRQISNWISAAAFAGGMILQTVEHGWRGAGSALAGTLAGASVFLIFYLLGGMGGGDVKLMAGFGALLGVKRLLEAALWTAGCGGILALCVLGVRALKGTLAQKKSDEDDAAMVDHKHDRRADSIPYAPAIAAGVWLSLVGAP